MKSYILDIPGWKSFGKDCYAVFCEGNILNNKLTGRKGYLTGPLGNTYDIFPDNSGKWGTARGMILDRGCTVKVYNDINCKGKYKIYKSSLDEPLLVDFIKDFGYEVKSFDSLSYQTANDIDDISILLYNKTYDELLLECKELIKKYNNNLYNIYMKLINEGNEIVLASIINTIKKENNLFKKTLSYQQTKDKINKYDLEEKALFNRPPMGGGLCVHKTNNMNEIIIGMVNNYRQAGPNNYAQIQIYNDNDGIRNVGKLLGNIEGVANIMSTGTHIHFTIESNHGDARDYERYVNKIEDLNNDFTATIYNTPIPVQWGFNYYDEKTKKQFLGFGRNNGQGIMYEYRNNWKDNYILIGGYPTGMAVNSKTNKAIISVSRGDAGIWEWDLNNDNVNKIHNNFGYNWLYIRNCPEHNLLIACGDDIPYISEYDNNWKKLHIMKPNYNNGTWREINKNEFEGGMFELKNHPKTNKPILFACGDWQNYNLCIYELHKKNNEWYAYEIYWKESCAGKWSCCAVQYNNELYFGTGKNENKADHLVSGILYKLKG